MQNSERFFKESTLDNNYITQFRIKKVLHSEKSKWQQIDVYETVTAGKLLTLDGRTMISDLDEFVYHESMAHIPYAVSKKSQNILVIGGGDGGVVTQLVKHKDIKHIDLVEIDQRVVEVSKEYFPQCSKGLDDPRVTIHYQDGIEFIKEIDLKYDIVIIDSTDPEEMALGLFASDFYSKIHDILSEDGLMVAQTENYFLDEYGIKKIYSSLKANFPIVESFAAPITIYPGVTWTFALASKGPSGRQINPQKIAAMRDIEKDCKWYNMDWHLGALAMSNFHKRKIGLV